MEVAASCWTRGCPRAAALVLDDTRSGCFEDPHSRNAKLDVKKARARQQHESDICDCVEVLRDKVAATAAPLEAARTDSAETGCHRRGTLSPLLVVLLTPVHRARGGPPKALGRMWVRPGRCHRPTPRPHGLRRLMNAHSALCRCSAPCQWELQFARPEASMVPRSCLLSVTVDMIC